MVVRQNGRLRGADGFACSIHGCKQAADGVDVLVDGDDVAEVLQMKSRSFPPARTALGGLVGEAPRSIPARAQYVPNELCMS